MSLWPSYLACVFPGSKTRFTSETQTTLRNRPGQQHVLPKFWKSSSQVDSNDAVTLFGTEWWRWISPNFFNPQRRTKPSETLTFSNGRSGYGCRPAPISRQETTSRSYGKISYPQLTQIPGLFSFRSHKNNFLSKRLKDGNFGQLKAMKIIVQI